MRIRSHRHFPVLLLLAGLPVIGFGGAGCHSDHDYDLRRGPFLTLVSASSTSVTIEWDSTFEDAKRLVVERRRRGRVNFRNIGRPAVTEREFIDFSVKPGRTYYYRLRAFFEGGRTARSVILRVEVPEFEAVSALLLEEGPWDGEPALSPGGSTLAWLEGGRVRLRDLEDGAESFATDGTLGNENGFAFHPGGRELLVTAGLPGEEDLFLTALGSGVSRRITVSGAGAARPSVSPHGEWVLIARGQLVILVDFGSGEETELPPDSPLAIGFAEVRGWE